MKTITLLRDVQAGCSQSQIIPAGSRVSLRLGDILPWITGTAQETGIDHGLLVGWEDVIGIGSRVEAGEADDHDTGTVDSIERVPVAHSPAVAAAWRLIATVRWDSGVSTAQPIELLSPLSIN